SDRINRAKQSMEVEGEDWQQLLKRAFGPPNNLTHYITHSRFLDWVGNEPAIARGAMLSLWDEGQDLGERVDEFVSQLPEDISTPGGRLQVISFLLMAYPTVYAPYRPSP